MTKIKGEMFMKGNIFKGGDSISLPVLYDSIPPDKRWVVREKYIEVQRGYCPHCKVLLKHSPPMPRSIDWSLFPNGKGFLDHPIHLHHCHKTGLTIGAVHAYCNADLWYNFGE